MNDVNVEIHTAVPLLNVSGTVIFLLIFFFVKHFSTSNVE